MGNESGQEPNRLFFAEHNKVIEETLRQAGGIIEQARRLTLHWQATVHYLLANVVRSSPKRMVPVLEAPTTSSASMFLAAAGYYREATIILRALIDLVLWEWVVRRATRDPRRNASLFGMQSRVHGPESDDLSMLFQLPEVKEYIRAMRVRARDEDHYRRLIEPVVESVVGGGLRKQLSEMSHGVPWGWNILHYDELIPYPDYSAEGLGQWFETFATTMRWTAAWCNLMFPDLMRWSANEPLEEEYGIAAHHDVWWNPVLDVAQIEFFMTWDPQVD